jgi:hypothetical protein
MTEYYEDMLETVSNGGSSASSATPHKNAAAEKSNDKNKNKNKKKKEEKPVYFKSNIRGRRIVYGDTGITTPHIVGTRDEDLYFKVNYTAHHYELEQMFLYYDNPMDYCIHYFTQLCPNRRIKHEDPELLKERIDAMYADLNARGILDEWKSKRDHMLYMMRRERAEEEEQRAVMVK